MRKLISFKHFIKTSMFLSICFSTLFACTNSGQVKETEIPKLSTKLGEMVWWNDVSRVNVANAEALLNNKSMFFQFNMSDFVSPGNPTPKKIHAYAAYTEKGNLGFYLINAEKDVMGSSTLIDDLKFYSIDVLDTNEFKSKWNRNNIKKSNESSNIGVDTAWSRVTYWNESVKKNNWIGRKYEHTSKNDTINVLNPVFSMFEINVSDLDPLKDHFCFLAVGVNSLNYDGSLHKIDADLIITNFEVEANQALIYNVEDLVHSIPPCKKNNFQCTVPKFGVLQRIIGQRMQP